MSAGSWHACGRTRRSSPTTAARCSNRTPSSSRPIAGRRSARPQQTAPRRRAPQQMQPQRGAAPAETCTMRMMNRPALPGRPDARRRRPIRPTVSSAIRAGVILHRAVGRARGRHHDVECLQRDVAIDRQRRLQSERTDAADLMAGDLGDLVEAEHFRLSAEQRLHLLVVHPRGAGGHDQHHALADPQATASWRSAPARRHRPRRQAARWPNSCWDSITEISGAFSAKKARTDSMLMFQDLSAAHQCGQVRRAHGCDDRARTRVRPSGCGSP